VIVNTRDVTDPISEVTAGHADTIHLVSSLDALSLWRAQASLQRLTGSGVSRDSLRLVINRYEKNPYISLSDAEKALNLKVAWTIPADPHAAQQALNGGVPLVIQNRNGIRGCFESYVSQFSDSKTSPRTRRPRRNLFKLFFSSNTAT
jgi:Flp pilus assembly CpaE family ATPase